MQKNFAQAKIIYCVKVSLLLFISNLLNDAVSRSDYTVIIDRILVNNELIRMWNKTVKA